MNETRGAWSAGADRTWSVGELAGSAGLTVRTLHYYDEIGLLPPSRRDGAGHRRYTSADVRRLHRIVALRGLGMSLPEIAGVIDDADTDPRELINQQLLHVEEEIVAAHRLRDGLRRVLDALDRTAQPSAQTLIEIIEVTNMNQRPFTADELRQMAERRREMAERLTPEELEEMNERRREAAAKLTPEQLEQMRRTREEMAAVLDETSE